MIRTHTMHRTRAQKAGPEEWTCPTCGRRTLLTWPPHYDKQIIEPGDEEVSHVCDTGPRRSLATPGETPPPETTETATTVIEDRRWRMVETGPHHVAPPGATRTDNDRY